MGELQFWRYIRAWGSVIEGGAEQNLLDAALHADEVLPQIDVAGLLLLLGLDAPLEILVVVNALAVKTLLEAELLLLGAGLVEVEAALQLPVEAAMAAVSEQLALGTGHAFDPVLEDGDDVAVLVDAVEPPFELIIGTLHDARNLLITINTAKLLSFL